MKQRSPKTFVLEIPEAPNLAFHADDETHAAAIARAPWFREAIKGFLAGEECIAFDSPRVRTATVVETKIYGELCEEFDGPTSQFLVADLSGFSKR